MENILSALIAGAVTLIGVLIAKSRSQAHNNFAQRIPVLEEQMKVANHRIADLETTMKERN